MKAKLRGEKWTVYLLLFSLIIVLLLTWWVYNSLTKVSKIKVGDLASFLLVDKYQKPLVLQGSRICIDSFLCEEPRDTLFANLPYSYDEMREQLHAAYSHIDQTLGGSKQTKQYAKALVTADLVYAAFSYQMDLGIEDSTLHSIQIQELKQTYDAGVQNKIALYCGQRAIFYTRLIAAELNLKARVKDIEGVHSFPLVTIGNNEYIMDPFDPFLVTDTNGVVLAYDQMLNQPIVIYHSQRTYGSTHTLISTQSLTAFSKNYSFCGLIEYYKKKFPEVTRQTITLADNLKQCKIVYPANDYQLALPTVGRPEQVFVINQQVLKAKYFE